MAFNWMSKSLGNIQCLFLGSIQCFQWVTKHYWYVSRFLIDNEFQLESMCLWSTHWQSTQVWKRVTLGMPRYAEIYWGRYGHGSEEAVSIHLSHWYPWRLPADVWMSIWIGELFAACCHVPMFGSMSRCLDPWSTYGRCVNLLGYRWDRFHLFLLRVLNSWVFWLILILSLVNEYSSSSRFLWTSSCRFCGSRGVMVQMSIMSKHTSCLGLVVSLVDFFRCIDHKYGVPIACPRLFLSWSVDEIAEAS